MGGNNQEFEFRLRAEMERAAKAQPAFNRQPDSLDNPNMAVEGQSWGQNALAGAGKALTDVGRGVGQFIGAIPQSSIDEAAERDKPLMSTGAGVTGNIAGNVAAFLPTMLIPGANTISGAGLIGTSMGALQPVKTGESRLENAAVGGLSGMAGQAAAQGISRIISPKSREAVKLLMKEGVTPTPGQILGGVFQTAEDKLMSVPIVGDAISSARRKGLDEFQRAAYSRALSPVGEKVSGEVGHAGVANVREGLQKAYNNLLPNLTFKADAQISDDLMRLQGMASSLPQQQSQRFNSVIEWMQSKITPSGLMNGQSLKEVESELGRLAAGYRADPSFDNRQLGNAITEVQDAIRKNLIRSNPAQAKELQAINSGWANYARVRAAAGSKGAMESGSFTPSQLASAIRSGDTTLGKRATSEGAALMQDLSSAGQNVLSPKYPDSGTVGRALLGTAIAGGGAMINPTAAAIGGAATLPYLPGGRQITAALLAKRPEIAKQLAEALRNTAPQIGMGAAALGTSQ